MSKPVQKLVVELERFIGAAPDCCAIGWDGSDRPVLVGAAGDCERVFGASAEALVGQPAGMLFQGGERAARDLALACVDGPANEQRSLLRGGKVFGAQLLLRGAPGGGAVALVRDLSAAGTQADAALRAEDLARFASLVAHEVRNPLSAVKIALQTLERHGTLGTNDLRRTAIAIREVGNIELLLNEVLEFARPPTLSLVPVDPRLPVRETVEQLGTEWEGRKVRFSLSVPERMSPVTADPTRLRTAVRILGRQAALANEEAGEPEVGLTVRELPGGRWELCVEDRGRTLAQELREKAFVPFTPNRARGSGLGLAVCMRIAQEHGGDARLDAREGGGNVVTLTLNS